MSEYYPQNKNNQPFNEDLPEVPEYADIADDGQQVDVDAIFDAHKAELQTTGNGRHRAAYSEEAEHEAGKASLASRMDRVQQQMAEGVEPQGLAKHRGQEDFAATAHFRGDPPARRGKGKRRGQEQEQPEEAEATDAAKSEAPEAQPARTNADVTSPWGGKITIGRGHNGPISTEDEPKNVSVRAVSDPSDIKGIVLGNNEAIAAAEPEAEAHRGRHARNSIAETAEAAARPVRGRRHARSEEASPEGFPILGERDGASEAPAVQTEITEGTDGQQHIAPVTTEQPVRRRVPTPAEAMGNRPRPIPEAVIPSVEAESANEDDLSDLPDDVRQQELSVRKRWSTLSELVGNDRENERLALMSQGSPAQRWRQKQTWFEEKADAAAEEMSATAAYGNEWGTFAGDDSEPAATAMTPDEARASAHRRTGEPERKHGQPVSSETEAYLKAAGEPQMGVPYVKPAEASAPAEEAKKASDNSLLDDLDFTAPEGTDGLYRGSPEDVDALDAAEEAKASATSGPAGSASYRTSTLGRLGRPMRPTPRPYAPAADEEDPFAHLFRQPVAEEDTSWADGLLPESEAGEAATPPRVPEANASDDDDAGIDILNGVGEDNGSEEPVGPNRRERLGMAFRNNWNKARAMVRRSNEEPDEYSTRSRNDSDRSPRHGTLFMTGVSLAAGAAVLGLVSSSANSGAESSLHDHVSSKPKASAPVTPGAKVDGGKPEGKPSADTSRDNDHRHEHGSGNTSTTPKARTIHAGNEDLKISADGSEVTIRLDQGGTVWDGLDHAEQELHLSGGDTSTAEAVQSMHLKPGQDRDMKVGSSYTFKVQGGKLVAKK